jgi:FMN-dependent oxidoreductase (nitrilotriacetate monooxygenase family)
MSTDRQGRMNLAAYIQPTGHHAASWRHPRSQKDANVNFKHYVQLAQTAERAKFDLMFLADTAAMREAAMEALCRTVQTIAGFEPLTLLSAIAAVTEKLGLVCTASTSWNAPYHIARKFASLDHISAGRAGWNAVTSGAHVEARNFGKDFAFEHAERYDRAHEMIKIVKALWDSWDDDAFMRDTDSGLYFDPEKMHVLGYHSDRYGVMGPLNVPRPPQGHPVIFQAGASEPGRELAAETAEGVFSPHLNIPAAKEFYDDVKGRMATYGRDPDHLRILPGLSIIVRPTDEEAEEDFQFLQSLIDPIVGRETLSTMLGVTDLTPYDLDGPLPDDLPPPKESRSQSTYDSIMKMARDENLTIRQLSQRVAGARGKNTFHGSPETVADYMEEWFVSRACDGFTIMPPYAPGCLDDFCELVIPELQRRGLFREDYDGTMLREHLGLPRPESRYADKGARASAAE